MRLTDWMQKEGKTYQDVASETGYSVSAIHKIANGEGSPRRKTIQDIARYTQGEVTANDLMGIHDDQVISNATAAHPETYEKFPPHESEASHASSTAA